MKYTYLDYAASTPIAQEVIDKMTQVMSNTYGNPSSIHQLGQDAKLEIELARDEVSSLLNAKPLEICFTSGGTESDNHAILGACFANEGKHIISSPIEHKAILNTLTYLEEKHGYNVSYLSIDSDGNIDLEELKSLIQEDTVLVSLMYVNNEIGIVNPIEKIGKICKERNVLFHTDAVQAVGKIDIDLSQTHVDLLSASGHKIYGPKGVGFTYIRKGTKVEKVIHGGAQEFDMRSGTENVVSIAGLGEAIKLCKQNMMKDKQHITELQSYLKSELIQNFDSIKFNGDVENKIYSIINVSFAGISGEAILHRLNSKGIAVSSGSACTSGSIEPSHVILELKNGKEYENSSIRISLGRTTTKDDIDYLIGSFSKIVKNKRS